MSKNNQKNKRKNSRKSIRLLKKVSIIILENSKLYKTYYDQNKALDFFDQQNFDDFINQNETH